MLLSQKKTFLSGSLYKYKRIVGVVANCNENARVIRIDSTDSCSRFIYPFYWWACFRIFHFVAFLAMFCSLRYVNWAIPHSVAHSFFTWFECRSFYTRASFHTFSSFDIYLKQMKCWFSSRLNCTTFGQIFTACFFLRRFPTRSLWIFLTNLLDYSTLLEVECLEDTSTSNSKERCIV